MSEHRIYNKLIRDRIPEIIAAEGRQCATENMNESEYQQALLAKLIEEAQEIAHAKPDEMMKELADLFEVIDTVIQVFGLDKNTIHALQQKRCDERGGFNKRLKLIWTD